MGVRAVRVGAADVSTKCFLTRKRLLILMYMVRLASARTEVG
jgi:hypothetical protein